MARPRWLDRSFGVLGGRVSAPVALLIGATLIASIVGAQSPLLKGLGTFSPQAVFEGHVWRLATWALFESQPLGLIFAGLALFWFGNDLVRIWGPGRFLVYYFGLAASAAIVTCLLAIPFDSQRSATYASPWPVVSSLIIAWATCFPARDIFLYLVVPLRGKNLIYATIGSTVLFALLEGFAGFIPTFAAQFLTIGVLRGLPIAKWWSSLRDEVAYRRWRRRASRLKAVPSKRREEDPPRWYH